MPEAWVAGWGAQYLLELGVGGVTHKLQNEPFTGGEEGATLSHPGQSHQPIHLAARGWEGVSTSAWTPRHLVDLAGVPPLGLPGHSIPVPTCTTPGRDPLTCGRSTHPPPRGPVAPGPGGRGLCSGGRETSGKPQTRTGVRGEGLGSPDGDEGGWNQDHLQGVLG